MRTAGQKRAICAAFSRLGLHATPAAVVQSLAQQGVLVGEELVRQVRFELLEEATGAAAGRGPRPVPPPGVRRRPKGFPGRQGKR
jgi:hypothetical protein